MNIAFATKLGWHLCTDHGRLWVQMIRSKYLRGRRTLDFQHTARAMSWTWSGIRNCYGSLRKGLCVKVGYNSTTRVYEDPWIPGLPDFVLPREVQAKDGIYFVRDLMLPDKTEWDRNLVTAAFAPEISNLILSIPLHAREHDSFVWAPSSSGRFSVRSSYRTNNGDRFGSLSMVNRSKWKHLWHAELHERHKFLVWKILVDIVPTKERIKQFVPLQDLSCFLCGAQSESLHHLVFCCPASQLCWWNSQWNIRIQRFEDLTVSDWFTKALDRTTCFQLHLSEESHLQFIQFAVLVFERIWLIRNKVRLGGTIPDWQEVSRSLNSGMLTYWQAAKNRDLSRHQNPPPSSWSPRV